MLSLARASLGHARRCWLPPQPPLLPLPTPHQQCRWMGGGKRNAEHKAQKRAWRRERKAAYRGLPLPPKPAKVVSTHFFESLLEYKYRPIPASISASTSSSIEEFIKTMWLIAYPMGANLRKLQRDIAFRMMHNINTTDELTTKLPYPVIMTIVGKLEREGYLKIKMSGQGHCLIVRDDDCIQFPNPYIVKYSGGDQQDASAKETSNGLASAAQERARPIQAQALLQPVLPKALE